MIEQAILSCAMRMYGPEAEPAAVENDFTLLAEDIPQPRVSVAAKKQPIGFLAAS